MTPGRQLLLCLPSFVLALAMNAQNVFEALLNLLLQNHRRVNPFGECIEPTCLTHIVLIELANPLNLQTPHD